MGEEIDRYRFTRADYRRFSQRLKAETELLGELLRRGGLEAGPLRAGMELEAWLVDADGRPAPRNEEVMERFQDVLIEYELAQYNLELNTDPQPLSGTPFSVLEAGLAERLAGTAEAAAAEGCRVGLIGILPSVTPEDLCLARMSKRTRYLALNEQVLAMRNREPIHLRIDGAESLELDHDDVMLESATTSLQLHLQVPPDDAAAYFNAAVAVSAATVAVAANSPYLFGRRLWEETRIPLFEQAVSVTPHRGDRAAPLARVTFGTGYARDGLYGFFVENRQHYAPLLPVCQDAAPERLAHLRLQNGTIWRWNRPIVEVGPDGGTHLRIEHRPMAAGPTVRDCVANAAFFYGLVTALARRDPPVASALPFATAEANFYAAARHGLAGEVQWFGGRRGRVDALVLEVLLPQAREGLEVAGVDAEEARACLEVIERRVRTGATGAAWQTAWVGRRGPDFPGLVQAYLERAATGEPVHRWAP